MVMVPHLVYNGQVWSDVYIAGCLKSALINLIAVTYKHAKSPTNVYSPSHTVIYTSVSEWSNIYGH